jgi:hypothetical protein
MTTITDEFMNQMLATSKAYCIVILNAGPNVSMEGADKIIWEHGRRNFSLQEDGLLSIVCPVPEGNVLQGIAIFNADMDKVREIMDDDPAVKEGIFTYEIHNARSFPGDCLAH